MRLLWGLVKLAALLTALVLVAGLAAFLTFQLATVAPSVEVPDIVGLGQTEATRRLDRAGLRILFEEDERNEFDETIPRDHVVRQVPPPGTELKQNRKVRVVLSLGPRNLYVPRVVAEPVTTAQARLQEAGLVVGELVYAPSDLVTENSVVDQQPRSLPPGGEEDRIHLLVSSGRLAPAYVMPDLIGLDERRARTFLERRGFRVRVETERYQGVPEGTVIRQKPLWGFLVREGDNIWIWVSENGQDRPQR